MVANRFSKEPQATFLTINIQLPTKNNNKFIKRWYISLKLKVDFTAISHEIKECTSVHKVKFNRLKVKCQMSNWTQ